MLQSPMALSPEIIQRLERLAHDASQVAYAPYSKFAVGAAVLTTSGKHYSGCNVENASYGLTNCAERTAIFSAIASGDTELVALVVYTPTLTPAPPCGSCRQVINEFGPECVVICMCDSDERIMTTALNLLPGAFGPKNLCHTRKSNS